MGRFPGSFSRPYGADGSCSAQTFSAAWTTSIFRRDTHGIHLSPSNLSSFHSRHLESEALKQAYLQATVFNRTRQRVESQLGVKLSRSALEHLQQGHLLCFQLLTSSPTLSMSGVDFVTDPGTWQRLRPVLTHRVIYGNLAGARRFMEIKKAIITAAGRNQHMLPLQTLVDRDGRQKTALQIILEEVLASGIEEICVVVSPGDQQAYILAAGPHAHCLKFVEQTTPLGYGHAVYCARDFTGRSPFLLLVGDHLYVSRAQKDCAQQLVEAAKSESCAVSAVQATYESKLPYYGTVGGRLVPNRPHLYLVDKVIEKPAPTLAEQELIVPGLRAGYYLCFFGMHVLTPAVMDLLGQMLEGRPGESVHLTQALNRLASQERYLACELEGRRYDIGLKYGLLNAQLALSLEGKDRQEVLAMLVELMALRGNHTY